MSGSGLYPAVTSPDLAILAPDAARVTIRIPTVSLRLNQFRHVSGLAYSTGAVGAVDGVIHVRAMPVRAAAICAYLREQGVGYECDITTRSYKAAEAATLQPSRSGQPAAIGWGFTPFTDADGWTSIADVIGMLLDAHRIGQRGEEARHILQGTLTDVLERRPGMEDVQELLAEVVYAVNGEMLPPALQLRPAAEALR
jgi:hypothetical protein